MATGSSNDQPTSSKLPHWQILNSTDVEPLPQRPANDQNRDPRSTEGQSTINKLPSWPILNSTHKEPEFSKKPAIDRNHDPRSQNVVPAMSTTDAREGHGSSSSRPTQDLDAAYTADADGRAKLYFGKNIEPERFPETTAGQQMVPPSDASQLPIKPTRTRSIQIGNVQVMPTDGEREICIEEVAQIETMFEAGEELPTIGAKIGIRWQVVLGMWKHELANDYPESERKRGQARCNTLKRRQRSLQKLRLQPDGRERRIESKAMKPL